MKEGFTFNNDFPFNNDKEGFMDVIDPALNAIQSLADGLTVGLSITSVIQSIFSAIANILLTGLQIAGAILQAFAIGITMFATIMQAIFFALGIAMAISLIIMLVVGGKSWMKGFGAHMDCAGLEFATGFQNTGTVLDVMASCSWYKFKNFLNGSCTRYYIVDMVFGILYGVFIELPLILINAIFGIDLTPLVTMIWNIFMLPLDALFFALSGFHLIKWPESVIRKCYRCEGKWTMKNGHTVTIYKTFAEWGQLLNCSGDQILSGINHIFTTLMPSERWGAWFNKRHLRGYDWEPGFWGSSPPPPKKASVPFKTAFDGVDASKKEDDKK
jgi:hypothetical protein